MSYDFLYITNDKFVWIITYNKESHNDSNKERINIFFLSELPII